MSMDINFYKLAGFTRPQSLDSIKVKDNIEALQERKPTLASGSFTINNKKIRVNISDNLKKIKEKINNHPDFKAKIVESDDGTQRLKIHSKKGHVKIEDHDGVLSDINAKNLMGKRNDHLIQFARKVDDLNNNKAAVTVEYIPKKQASMPNNASLIDEILTRHLAESRGKNRASAPAAAPVLAPAPTTAKTAVVPASPAPMSVPAFAMIPTVTAAATASPVPKMATTTASPAPKKARQLMLQQAQHIPAPNTNTAAAPASTLPNTAADTTSDDYLFSRRSLKE